MFDDLRQTLRKMRGDYTSNGRTSLGTTRNMLKNLPKWGWVLLGLILVCVAAKYQDGLMIALYSLLPYFLDSSLVLESVPLVSRVLPRATILLELGTAQAIAIPLTAFFAVYKLLGTIRMGIPYYGSLKE